MAQWVRILEGLATPEGSIPLRPRKGPARSLGMEEGSRDGDLVGVVYYRGSKMALLSYPVGLSCRHAGLFMSGWHD